MHFSIIKKFRYQSSKIVSSSVSHFLTFLFPFPLSISYFILTVYHTHSFSHISFSFSYVLIFLSSACPPLCCRPTPLGIVLRLNVIESFSTPGQYVSVCVCVLRVDVLFEWIVDCVGLRVKTKETVTNLNITPEDTFLFSSLPTHTN